jgi:putative transposase
MKKTKVSASKNFQILKEAESGIPVSELCRKYGFSNASCYSWRSRYGGLQVSDMRCLKELED